MRNNGEQDYYGEDDYSDDDDDYYDDLADTEYAGLDDMTDDEYHAMYRKSQITSIAPFSKMLPKNLDFRCVFILNGHR